MFTHLAQTAHLQPSLNTSFLLRILFFYPAQTALFNALIPVFSSKTRKKSPKITILLLQNSRDYCIFLAKNIAKNAVFMEH